MRPTRLWSPVGQPPAVEELRGEGKQGEDGASHPEDSCKAGRGGGCRSASSRGGGAQAGCREDDDADDEIGLPSSIPLEGSKREDQRSSWKTRPHSGRPGTEAESGGHGGQARDLQVVPRERDPDTSQTYL
jgi:hypothetical protein